MSRILIKGGTLLTMDPQYGQITCGDVLVGGNKIVEVGGSYDAGDAEVIDATDMIVIPGFVDGHRHTWQALIRATAVDWTLSQYFTGVKKTIGDITTAEDMYYGNLLGALECLDCGITSLYDFCHNLNGDGFADEAIRGLRESGIRAVFGYGDSAQAQVHPEMPLNYADARRVRKQYFPSDDGLVTMGLAIRGPQWESFEYVTNGVNLAKELGLNLCLHAGDGLWGKVRAVTKMYEAGYLDETCTYIHCNMITDEERKMIGDTGGNTVSCPEVELNMGHGFLPTLSLMKYGVRPSLGIDIVTSVPGEMFSPMRAMLMGTRMVFNQDALLKDEIVDPLPLMASDVLEFATLQGAAALKMKHKTGSLTPGKEADIVLVNTSTLNMLPMNNPVGILVEGATVANIDTVMVAGKIVKRDGKLLGVDLPAMKKKINEVRDAMFERAAVPTTGEWLPVPMDTDENIPDN